MKNKSFIIRLGAVTLFSLALCFASVLGSRLATQYDLGQIAYMLVIFFPITAAITGIAASVYLQRIWLTPLIVLIVFLITMLVFFGSFGYTYILIYMVVSLIGYILANLVRDMLRKR